MCASQYRNNILRINFHSSPRTVPYDPGEGKTKVEGSYHNLIPKNLRSRKKKRVTAAPAAFCEGGTVTTFCKGCYGND